MKLINVLGEVCSHYLMGIYTMQGLGSSALLTLYPHKKKGHPVRSTCKMLFS